LKAVGIPLPVSDPSHVPPSVWIALYENIISSKLPINRTSITVQSMQILLDSISSLVKAELSHISPASLLNGDPTSCTFLAEILAEIYKSINGTEGSTSIVDLDDVSSIEKYDGTALDDFDHDISADFESSPSPPSSKRSRAVNESEFKLAKKSRTSSENDETDVPSQLKVKPTDSAQIKALKRQRLADRAAKHLADSISSLGPHHQGHPQTIPERNLVTFQDKVVHSIVPHIKIDPYITERTWNSQISTWKHALDDRIWSQRVLNHNAQSDAKARKKKEALLKKTEDTNERIKQLKDFETAKREAIARTKERERELVKIGAQFNEIDREAHRQSRKRQLQAEQILLKSHQDYIKVQRDAIIEERRYARVRRRSLEIKQKMQRESRARYLQDQIDIDKERLRELESNEAIAGKASKEAERQRVREGKSFARSEIGRIRDKLKVDTDNAWLIEEDLERIKKRTLFTVVEGVQKSLLSELNCKQQDV